MTPSDISVVGPMARHAEDLDLALRALAGPDRISSRFYRSGRWRLNKKRVPPLSFNIS
jgi:Asp-tRNA(Asn)/Glu-tRNA(Gln) amidotransferase A subunit family amidase